MIHKRTLIGILLLCVCLSGCGQTNSKGNETSHKKNQSKEFKIYGTDSYDSQDLAILKSVNEDARTITFWNTQVQKNYTLSFDGTTRFYDKNDQDLTYQQLVPGDLMFVTFLKDKKHLNTATVSRDAFVMEDVNSFEISDSGKIIEIRGEKYRVTSDTVFYASGNEVDLMDINVNDSLKVVGIDHTIYSITVTTGHGYLRLENETALIGGWIEVGNSIICPIKEDMMLVVPEGEYEVIVSYGSESIKEKITIQRNQETTLDVSGFVPEKMKYGNLFFTVNTDDAEVYIDGKQIDIAQPNEMSYGLHQLVVKAKGYETISKYIKVASPYASLAIELKKDSNYVEESLEVKESTSTKDETKESKTESEEINRKESSSIENSEAVKKETAESKPAETNATETKKQTDTTASTSFRVYIDSPSGVEVYLDGAYVGLAPVSFIKVSGSHTIILRKQGYVTRSYTINVDSEQRDISYSFSDLLRDTDGAAEQVVVPTTSTAGTDGMKQTDIEHPDESIEQQNGIEALALEADTTILDSGEIEKVLPD